jgi:membrane protease YdiL (CAAX protease family)
MRAILRLGEVNTPSAGVSWLGIPPGMAWGEIAATMGLWITLGTGVFMFFQLRQAGVGGQQLLRSLPQVLPWVVLFSAANAFSEEAIFRAALVGPLMGLLPVTVILALSAVLFGAPHYFGMPKGVLGALMAGFLGWLLALSVLETHGLLLAWAVHFVQDVVIISSLLWMGRNKRP